MKIGELSAHTGIPTRMLRYYEQQGLLDAERADNGYRDYSDTAIERAERVRGLVQAGLSTRMTRVVLDIEQQCADGLPRECSRELAAELEAELSALETRLACLTKSRDAVAEYLRRSAPTAAATPHSPSPLAV